MPYVILCPHPQLNEITPYLDGNLMYGAGKAIADAVRSFKDGKLAADDESADIRDSVPKQNDIRLPMANPPSPRDHVLRPVSRFYREFLFHHKNGYDDDDDDDDDDANGRPSLTPRPRPEAGQQILPSVSLSS